MIRETTVVSPSPPADVKPPRVLGPTVPPVAIQYNTIGVYLNCSNAEKSAAFYEGLGFKRARFYPEMNVYGYNLGKATFVLGPSDLEAPDKVKKWLAHKPWGVGAVIMPNVKSVDAVYELAKKIGAEIEEPPTDQPWGSRTLQVVDPDGYSIMFEQDPAPAKNAKKAKAAKPKPKARSAVKKAGSNKRR